MPCISRDFEFKEYIALRMNAAGWNGAGDGGKEVTGRASMYAPNGAVLNEEGMPALPINLVSKLVNVCVSSGEGIKKYRSEMMKITQLYFNQSGESTIHLAQKLSPLGGVIMSEKVVIIPYTSLSSPVLSHSNSTLCSMYSVTVLSSSPWPSPQLASTTSSGTTINHPSFSKFNTDSCLPYQKMISFPLANPRLSFFHFLHTLPSLRHFKRCSETLW
jgi:Holliday junction resolvasome RuvABC endonuclease subunit